MCSHKAFWLALCYRKNLFLCGTKHKTCFLLLQYIGKTAISQWCRKRWELKYRLGATWNQKWERGKKIMHGCNCAKWLTWQAKGWTAHKSLEEQRPKARGGRTHENLWGNTPVYWGFPIWWGNLTCFHSGLQLGQACPGLEYSRWQPETGCAYLLKITIPLTGWKKQVGSATPCHSKGKN